MRRLLALALVATTASGCFTARYLGQAAVGQARLIGSAKPLSSVVRDPKTPPEVQRLLGLVPDMKAFGESMGLKPTDNYARYTDLHRAAAVWVVQACRPLAFEPLRWSFPIAGTVPYLGFFDEQAAHAYAEQLAQGGTLDVDVRGASAYSTLGWFKDPVLSTMLSDGPEGAGWLANTVLHESVHATLYFPGQSSFNESLASFIGDKLTTAWLARRFGVSSREVKSYTASAARAAERIARLHRAYEELDAVYRSTVSDDQKRARKAELLAELKVEFKLKRDLNNASLFGYRTYDSGGPAFARLFERCDDDLSKLLEVVRTLSPADFPEAQMDDFSAVIDALAPR
ncbi:MAG: aminopeptidase [Archangiaceae bacterium]|nr:aminopeptidase [Archangiaceae bacterium]